MDDKGAERLGRALANIVVVACFLFMVASIFGSKHWLI